MEAFRILLMRPLPTREWTEKCFVAFLLLLSRSEFSDSKRIRTLRGVIDALEKRGYPSISARTAHATVIVRQTLIMVNERADLLYTVHLENDWRCASQERLLDCTAMASGVQ